MSTTGRVLPPDPFAPGEDRLACSKCGTHNSLGQPRCWNCKTALSDADRIAFQPGSSSSAGDRESPAESEG